ncbi:MAG: agmatinase [candidate division WOR-3 bacterium]
MRFLAYSKKNSDLIIIGVPYESEVVFKKGASIAPKKIREGSEAIEYYSPYQNKIAKNFYDEGDIEIKNLKKKEIFKKIKEKIKNILKDDKKFILIGGDHTITYPAVLAIKEFFKEFILIHIDAHLDRRKIFKKDEINYATVIKRIEEKIGEENVFTFGVRAKGKEEKITKNIYFFNVYENIKKIENILKTKKFYVSIDLDVLDPAFFPAVTNPEPGGIDFKEILNTIIFLSNFKENIIGFDVVEYNPLVSQEMTWAISASIIIREIICSLI